MLLTQLVKICPLNQFATQEPSTKQSEQIPIYSNKISTDLTASPIFSMENHDAFPKVKNDYSAYQPLMLASNDTEFLCPIEYIYDYLPLQAKWLKSQPVSLRRLFAVSEECNLVPAFILSYP